MKRHSVITSVLVGTGISAGVLTIAAQDRFALKVPDGLAFSEFKGYDTWQVIAPSETDESVKAIVGNDIMIRAYRQGIPANGNAVPDGAMMAKIEWAKRPSTVSPYAVRVPDKLASVALMVKDARRFSPSGGWGYAKFTYDPTSDAFKPAVTGSACGYACHTRVKTHDYVFTEYGKR